MATMSFRPKSKSSIGQKRKGAKGNKDAVLSFTLQHGDIMVMHGPLVQKLYEVRHPRTMPKNTGLFVDSTRSIPMVPSDLP